MLNGAQELVYLHRHSQETVAAYDPGGHELPFRNKVAQTKQGNMAKIAIFLKLPGNDFSVASGASEIDHDQVGAKPTRDMNSESGIVFFADGILAGILKSSADRVSGTRFVIQQKNFFEDLHEISLNPSIGYASGALRQDRIFYLLSTERLRPALLTLWCT
jgi:hypothetical protein